MTQDERKGLILCLKIEFSDGLGGYNKEEVADLADRKDKRERRGAKEAPGKYECGGNRMRRKGISLILTAAMVTWHIFRRQYGRPGGRSRHHRAGGGTGSGRDSWAAGFG